MNITVAQLQRQRYALPRTWRAAIRAVAAMPSTPHVDYYLLLAVMSRETGMRNIVGDGGHGRGGWQLDDRYQGTFLASTPGCKQGTSTPRYRSAASVGLVPTVTAGARRCAMILEANIVETGRAGVPFGHRLQVAVSAWNAGMGGAMEGWRNLHNSDALTTGHDYAADVLARASALRAAR